MTDEQPTRKVSISKTVVLKFASRISALKQRLDDTAAENTTIWKEFEEAGGNKAAFKAVMKLKNQDQAKTADFQFHFDFYADVIGLVIQPDLLDDPETVAAE